MPSFTYVALDSRGQESTGLVEAASTNEAIGQLRQAGFTRKEKAGGAMAKRPSARPKPRVSRNRAKNEKASFFSSAKKLNRKS